MVNLPLGSNVCAFSPVSTLHRLMLPDLLLEAINLPSGLNAIAQVSTAHMHHRTSSGFSKGGGGGGGDCQSAQTKV